jgi:hypothetical protein
MYIAPGWNFKCELRNQQAYLLCYLSFEVFGNLVCLIVI